MRRRARLTALAVTAAALLAGCSSAPSPDGGTPSSSPAAAGPLDGGAALHTDPDSPAARWVGMNAEDPRAARIKPELSDKPMARWFTETSDTDIAAAVRAYTAGAKAAGTVPQLVAYALPGRDACGEKSAGGITDAAGYRLWITAFAEALAGTPALVILEPDALGDFDCLANDKIAERNELLKFAVAEFAAKSPRTWTYLDAGNATWVDAPAMATRLRDAGLEQAHGFAVNVSSFYDTPRSDTYAAELRAALGAPTPYVIDTSRNANGPAGGDWCNPPGRKLGTISTDRPDALHLWIKNPGSSDGECGIAPTVKAGVFDPALALKLITGS